MIPPMIDTAPKSDLFRLIADSAPVLIWMAGPDKLCHYFNKTWLDFTGRSLEQEHGNGWLEGVHFEDKERCMRTYIESFDLREKFRMEYRLRRQDGEYRWLLDIGVPRFDAGQVFAGYIGIGVDVTDRKHTEQELERTNQRLQLSMEAGRIGGWDSDLETGERFWFGRTHELMNMPSERVPSSEEAWSRVHPDDRIRLQIALDNAKLRMDQLRGGVPHNAIGRIGSLVAIARAVFLCPQRRSKASAWCVCGHYRPEGGGTESSGA